MVGDAGDFSVNSVGVWNIFFWAWDRMDAGATEDRDSQILSAELGVGNSKSHEITCFYCICFVGERIVFFSDQPLLPKPLNSLHH